MAVAMFNDLVEHVDHNIEVTTYGQNANVAIECLTCYEVLLDFDKE